MMEQSVFSTYRKFLLVAAVLVVPFACVGQKPENKVHDFYGLYYCDEGSQLALVISPDGKPIPPKLNDPDAPTQPGLYVDQQRFDFARSQFSANGFSFRTKKLRGTSYSFRGQFGRAVVDVIPDVPYLAGTLLEVRNGRIVRKVQLHFGHAVIL
jgi:hypothetical protein